MPLSPAAVTQETSLLSASPNVTIPGDAMGRIAFNATITFTSIAAVTGQEQTVTVPGAVVGNNVFATPQAQINPVANTQPLSWSSWISAASTVTVRVVNASAGAITPNAVVWRIDIF